MCLSYILHIFKNHYFLFYLYKIFELKNTINTMVDTLRSFAAEVTRVAKEVGTEGKLGGQADVKGESRRAC